MSPTSLSVRVGGIHACTLQDRDTLVAQSQYLAEHWKEEENVPALELEPPLPRMRSETVGAFLTALETNEFGSSFFQSQPSHEFYALWLLFRCHTALLQSFLATLSVSDRLQLLEYCHNNNNEATRLNTNALLALPAFCHEMTKAEIPLDRSCCRSPKVAACLLQAWQRAPTDWSPVSLAGSALLSGWRHIMGAQALERLSPHGFAVLALQRFAAEEAVLWELDEVETVLGTLQDIPVTPNNAIGNETKPAGLERILALAIRSRLAIPAILKQQWPLDEALLAPALWEAQQLDQVTTFANPQVILATICGGWTPERCAAALENNEGHLQTLLQQWHQDHPAHGCDWLAHIPVFCATRLVLPAHSPLQVLLYRLLFLHVDFDPALPPSLLETVLPPHGDQKNNAHVGRKAVEHALQYLEGGILDARVFGQLNWQKFGSSPAVVGRAVRALAPLDADDTCALWDCLDLGQFAAARPSQWQTVPPGIVAAHAVLQVQALQSQVKQLTAEKAELQTQVDEQARRLDRLEQRLTAAVRAPPPPLRQTNSATT